MHGETVKLKEVRVLDHPTLRTQYPTVIRVRDGQPTERSSIPGKEQSTLKIQVLWVVKPPCRLVNTDVSKGCSEAAKNCVKAIIYGLHRVLL